MNEFYLKDETQIVNEMLKLAELPKEAQDRVQERAKLLVESVRTNQSKKAGIEAFLQQYDLSSEEGIILMCLAEALLRIPDSHTADKLIRDKLSEANWKQYLGTSESWFVNASTWGLMLTGKVIKPDPKSFEDPGSFMSRMVSRTGEPVIRTAIKQAMKIMGHQFVMGRTIDDAIKRTEKKANREYRYSFDMLGEAALTAADAKRYLDAYAKAIEDIGAKVDTTQSIFSIDSISVKLSALHPRYEFAQRQRVLDELIPNVLMLAQKAKMSGIALTIDAEEADRLELAMEVFEGVYRSETLNGWEGLGLAVQAYQKRAYQQLQWLQSLAHEVGRKLPVRLVKGAYWDTEIKAGQEQGLDGFPVYTRKASTDVAYLACAKFLLESRDNFYPQFATHNAHTLASIVEMAGGDKRFEFQRLHGMGEELYAEVIDKNKLDFPCRVYAPVGSHEDLLPYLVRRLLENGANTSFVNRIMDESVSVDDIVESPTEAVSWLEEKPHPSIRLAKNLFRGTDSNIRANSQGYCLADHEVMYKLQKELHQLSTKEWVASPIINGKSPKVNNAEYQNSTDPTDHRNTVGKYVETTAEQVELAITECIDYQSRWDATPAVTRAELLRRTADLFEKNTAALLSLCIREAGKSIPDSISELREAVDFLRYYADQCVAEFSEPLTLPGPTGELNQLSLHGKGAFVCISPWNFPLAIFIGQIAAALAAGNTVLAKPAEQTTLVAAEAVRLMHSVCDDLKLNKSILQFIPGQGSTIGAQAVADPRIAGVVFTGSTEVAQIINLTLAQRKGSIATLIAETGGQNCMIVDSSALPEQVVNDVVASSFNSAGQRCSALRVMFLQEDIAPRVLEVLKGAMDELVIGDPACVSTDVGPVIDAEAKSSLEKHIAHISQQGKLIYKLDVPSELQNGTFVAPAAIEVSSLDDLDREQFGPILHVIKYKAKDIDKVIAAINSTGYGLTVGIHTRIESFANRVATQIKAGNAYINRNMIGAVVGVQPFGGMGLSGTGPKAGGPHYLHRFATEKTITINTAAVGGNASLLSLEPST